jgi:acyl-CoA synthetase (AMP-forming)/AMP-acid ligase II
LGLPSEEWGEEVAAVVTPHSTDDMPTPQELFEFCRANLTHFKAPRQWSITTRELPHTQSGKAQKFVLREIILNGEIKIERV